MLFDFGYVSPRWIWVGLVIFFSLIEIFTLGLYTVWFAIAALIMVFVSLTGIALPYQILIFLAISASLLFYTRPLVVKKLKIGKIKTNVESLVGMHALVTKKIKAFESGEVKLNGQIWSARIDMRRIDTENNITEIQEGTKCEVVRIEGVFAIVRPLA
jgi:membrane protein implicated in regulation of membrane protease activity